MTRKEKIAGIEEFLTDSRAELAHGATGQYADSIRQTIAQCELQLGKLTRPAALRHTEETADMSKAPRGVRVWVEPRA